MKLTNEQLRQSAKKRRKHQQYRVVATYADGEQFARVFVNNKSADRYAFRHEGSPFLKSAELMKW